MDECALCDSWRGGWWRGRCRLKQTVAEHSKQIGQLERCTLEQMQVRASSSHARSSTSVATAASTAGWWSNASVATQAVTAATAITARRGLFASSPSDAPCLASALHRGALTSLAALRVNQTHWARLPKASFTDVICTMHTLVPPTCEEAIVGESGQKSCDSKFYENLGSLNFFFECKIKMMKVAIVAAAAKTFGRNVRCIARAAVPAMPSALGLIYHI